MPPYLVTLRHAETGEYKRIAVEADDVDDAVLFAEEHHTIPEDEIGEWVYAYAEPADDAPVPGRDR